MEQALGGIALLALALHLGAAVFFARRRCPSPPSAPWRRLGRHRCCAAGTAALSVPVRHCRGGGAVRCSASRRWTGAHGPFRRRRVVAARGVAAAATGPSSPPAAAGTAGPEREPAACAAWRRSANPSTGAAGGALLLRFAPNAGRRRPPVASARRGARRWVGQSRGRNLPKRAAGLRGGACRPSGGCPRAQGDPAAGGRRGERCCPWRLRLSPARPAPLRRLPAGGSPGRRRRPPAHPSADGRRRYTAHRACLQGRNPPHEPPRHHRRRARCPRPQGRRPGPDPRCPGRAHWPAGGALARAIRLPARCSISCSAPRAHRRRVAQLTENRFRLQVFPAGEIASARCRCWMRYRPARRAGHTAAYYYIGKGRASPFTAMTFGLTTRRQLTAWFRRSGGNGSRQRYSATQHPRHHRRRYQCPDGRMVPQRDHQPSTSCAGLKFRITGLAGQLFTRLGAAPTLGPAGRHLPGAGARGDRRPPEFVGPHDDERGQFFPRRPLLLRAGVLGTGRGCTSWPT